MNKDPKDTNNHHAGWISHEENTTRVMYLICITAVEKDPIRTVCIRLSTTIFFHLVTSIREKLMRPIQKTGNKIQPDMEMIKRAIKRDSEEQVGDLPCLTNFSISTTSPYAHLQPTKIAG